MRRVWHPALWTALLLLLAQLRPGSGRGPPARPPRGPAARPAGGARGLRLLLLLLPLRLAERPAAPEAFLEAGGQPGLGPERPKRGEPPLSIDLTFHLLRTLLELARTQSQRERAEQNRLIFDTVGK
ncbi:urocortin [Tachyglossus aculeatus]|uniref:urocortin n=1 Tax=Tachyglossus aculeatus TaxID=9261 RepID=UPI0018F69021|nr:urocortin [Tachyglossus aculeatus]